MPTRRTILAAGTSLVLASFTPAWAQETIPVVATFSILGDMVAEVGGDRVAVTTLVGPDGDAHVYQPTPADAQAVARAQVVFVNGLEFEGWIDRLVEASGYDGPVVTATDGVGPRGFEEEDGHAGGEAHAEGEGGDHGVFDPHAWQSIANARIYVANITEGLATADPGNAADYAASGEAYMAELAAVEAEIEDAIGSLPENRRTVVTSHDAFGYFGAAYGLSFEAPQGMSTETEASAADVASLITQIRDASVPAVFVENITDSRLLEQITSETDATIGGTLYSDALSGPDGPATTYTEMMRHNAATLADALGQ